MKRLRVALVTHYFPAHRGGVELVAWELARRLAERGAAEIVWHASATEAPPPERSGLRCVPAPAWNIAERRLGFPYPLWTPRALSSLAATVRESDVLHIHDCLYLPNVAAWAAAKRAGKPVLVTQHVGMVPYRSVVLRALLASANRLLGGPILGRSSQAVFVSAAVLEYFAGFVRFDNRPLRIPNGVDTTVFTPAAHERRDGDRPVALFVGRFVEKKGLALLRQLATSMPQVHWVFAGWGPIEPERWNLANVTVRRNLSQEELVPLYRAADLLVLPSVGEGFPLVIQEAMACGTPALVSTETAAGCPEAAAVLLAEPLGEDAAPRWQSRLESLFKGASAERKRRAAEFAHREWSWDRCTARYEELLLACAG